MKASPNINDICFILLLSKNRLTNYHPRLFTIFDKKVNLPDSDFTSTPSTQLLDFEDNGSHESKRYL